MTFTVVLVMVVERPLESQYLSSGLQVWLLRGNEWILCAVLLCVGIAANAAFSNKSYAVLKLF